MNILIISTSDMNGGAAIAANRLFSALKLSGINVKMAVRDKLSNNSDIIEVGSDLLNKWNFYSERAEIFLNNQLSRKSLFEISTASVGVSITEMDVFKQADVIHLHWINQGMLSLKEIKKILSSGKKVIWTMHDMWPFTGICHYSGNCNTYTTGCGNCPYLQNPSENDLSRKTFKKKQSTYSKAEIIFAGCSKWIKEMASKSALTVGHHTISIPNPIDTSFYQPLNKMEVRKELNLPINKKIILFAAVKASDKRKGLSYLTEAANKIKDYSDELLFLIAGNRSEELESQLSIPVKSMGYISPEDMPNLYNAADLFVSPSLQDNLPNTIMESMACGTPCIGFNTGGIPEMIDHLQNGYVAEYKSSTDLAQGIIWSLFKANTHQLSQHARSKVVENYSNEVVANQYIDIYRNARG